MKNKLIILLSLFLFSCVSTKTEEVVEQSYPDGSPKIVKVYADNGTTRVLIKETNYYANHAKYMEGGYLNDKRDGLWISWYQNGNKWSEGNFKNGLDDGKRTGWYENGKKHFDGTYKDGKKIGMWKFYDENGLLLKEVDYDKNPE
ncbi:MAG: hypothetical protein WCM76_01590 [Bacteroidota bacterium]